LGYSDIKFLHTDCNELIIFQFKLSERGRKFSACLSRFIYMQKMLFRQKQLEKHREEHREEVGLSESPISLPEPLERNFLVWTSMLKRTIETVENFDPKEFDIMVYY
jgi:6-phosphofructo-2-kinase